ncbi:MAG: hypothetical protein JXR73_06850 [Candidatus Omnitrophica bacterium]|nr:hypothetical protein [Candidatus Omnitrophota bacterium]
MDDTTKKIAFTVRLPKKMVLGIDERRGDRTRQYIAERLFMAFLDGLIDVPKAKAIVQRPTNGEAA